jgi:hypothetical protein
VHRSSQDNVNLCGGSLLAFTPFQRSAGEGRKLKTGHRIFFDL